MSCNLCNKSSSSSSSSSRQRVAVGSKLWASPVKNCCENSKEKILFCQDTHCAHRAGRSEQKLRLLQLTTPLCYYDPLESQDSLAALSSTRNGHQQSRLAHSLHFAPPYQALFRVLVFEAGPDNPPNAVKTPSTIISKIAFRTELISGAPLPNLWIYDCPRVGGQRSSINMISPLIHLRLELFLILSENKLLKNQSNFTVLSIITKARSWLKNN